MVNEVQARKVHGDVRFFYKWELKSGNKSYQGGAVTAKSTTRNKNQTVANSAVTTFRNTVKGKSLAEMAQAVSAMGAGARIGNCFEMALLACHYASQAGIARAWVGSIGGLGDHAFCLLGAATAPDWSCPLKMGMANDRTLWVVDPWANVCCTAPDYYSAFRKKMDKWSTEKKAVAFKGQWTDPGSADYSIGFQIGSLSFQQVY
jgi:hypothetical protein